MKLTAYYTPQRITVSVTAPSATISTGTLVARDLVERDPYTGDYEVTPSSEEQVLLTNGLRMTDNVTVKPIPSNYGLITWNGSVITVS